MYHECEGVIEESVPRITVWHCEACLGLQNSDPKEWIFLVHPHLNNMRIHRECEGWIEKSVPGDHRLESRGLQSDDKR